MDPRPESWMNAEVSTGTTIMACVFAGGVVVGADSRVSTGTYVSNRASDKITPLADNVFLCRSGSAADTQLVSDYVRYFAQQHSMELEGEISVKTVANLTKSINYNNKHLSAAMIVGGYDSMRGGQVYSLPIGGTVVPCNWTVDGSGSTYIWGYCDSEYREGMSQEETEKFVTEAIALAMCRDGSSGGLIRLVVIDKSGTNRKLIRGDDIPLFPEELRPVVGMAVDA